MISVIIPTLNRDGALADTLRDLLRQEGPAPFEVLVVDQNARGAPAAEGPLMVFVAEPRIRWLSSPARGVVYGRNLAIHESRGDLLVFVDDDVRIEDTRFLERHFDAHGREPGVAAICGAEFHPWRRDPAQTLGYPRGLPLADVLFFPRNFHARTEATIFSTCNGSIRKDAIRSVGCFDERFEGASYGDDADLALRLTAAGQRVVYDPAPALVHLMATAGGLRINDDRAGFTLEDKYLSACLFYRKHVRHAPRPLRRFHVFHHILRKSLLLKANVLRPYRWPGVALAILRADRRARNLLREGHRWSFGEGVAQEGKPHDQLD